MNESRKIFQVESRRPSETFRDLLLTALILSLLGGSPRLSAEPSDSQLPQRSQAVDPWRGLAVKSVARFEDTPVYQIGHSFVLGTSPDFADGVTTQDGLVERPHKIAPKKSWEISGNFVGLHFNHPPMSIESDFQPFLAINLLDGNPGTCWCSRGVGQADAETVWIRIDLPKEVAVTELILRPRRAADYFDGPKPYGECFPNDIVVKGSTDRHEWTLLHEAEGIARPAVGEPYKIKLAGEPKAKSIWIQMSRLRMESGYPREFKVMLAEVEVIDDKGANAASVNRGATVTVSSTNYGHGSERTVVNELWPAIYDLGVKWVRLSGWANDPLLWHNVERVRGEYSIDPITDATITELDEKKVNVLMILAYGNWQYAADPKPNRSKGIWTIPFDWPPMDLGNEEMREGFKQYAQFMARHFRGRVACYEIWNEPNLNLTADGKVFAAFAKEVAEVIRAEDPDAKIMSGSIGIGPGGVDAFWKYLHDQIDAGILASVDAFGWHPSFERYPEQVKALRDACVANGHPDTEFMITETGAGPYGGGSELATAAGTLRNYVMNAGLGISAAFWNDSIETQYAADPGIFRNGFSSDPVNTQAPKPVYYMLRTLATAMDGATSGSMPIEFGSPNPDLETYQFTLGQKSVLYAVWLRNSTQDISTTHKTDVLLKGIQAGSVVAIDTLNGNEVPLNCEFESSGTRVKGLSIPEYPLLLRATGIVWTGHLQFND